VIRSRQVTLVLRRANGIKVGEETCSDHGTLHYKQQTLSGSNSEKGGRCGCLGARMALKRKRGNVIGSRQVTLVLSHANDIKVGRKRARITTRYIRSNKLSLDPTQKRGTVQVLSRGNHIEVGKEI
jgi:hypothetical protein